jgi:hypothetical protein
VSQLQAREEALGHGVVPAIQARLAEVKRIWPGGKGRKGYQSQQGSRVAVFPQELLSGGMVCSSCGSSIAKVSGKGGGYYGCLKASLMF